MAFFRRITIGAVGLPIVAIFAGAQLSAHPLATTTVSVAVSAGQVDVTIVAEADPMLMKLEALAGAEPDVAKVSRFERLNAVRQALLARVAVALDGERVPLQWRDAVIDNGSTVTIRLAGRGSPSAHLATWAASFVYGSYPVGFHVGGSNGESIQWLQANETSAPVALAGAQGFARTVSRALWLGLTHIVPNGVDHILFVLGLLFLSMRTRQVLLQVTAFTLAHSITLGLTLYGVISLRSSIVEPLIALSVAYVGIENLMTTDLKPWRVAIVFAFGLLHGMGFADALANLHLARSQFLTTLVSFNVGVESGQLLVIGVAAAALFAATRARDGWRRPITRLASAGIGLTGFVWTVQRIVG